jgi:hypothetical protein
MLQNHERHSIRNIIKYTKAIGLTLAACLYLVGLRASAQQNTDIIYCPQGGIEGYGMKLVHYFHVKASNDPMYDVNLIHTTIIDTPYTFTLFNGVVFGNTPEAVAIFTGSLPASTELIGSNVPFSNTEPYTTTDGFGRTIFSTLIASTEVQTGTHEYATSWNIRFAGPNPAPGTLDAWDVVGYEGFVGYPLEPGRVDFSSNCSKLPFTVFRSYIPIVNKD